MVPSTNDTLYSHVPIKTAIVNQTKITDKEKEIKMQNSSGKLLSLAICASGICFCYLSYGIIIEHLLKSVETQGPITSFLLLGQTLTNVVVAWFWLTVEGNIFRDSKGEKNTEHGNKRLNHKLIMAASFCYFAAMQSTNESLNYVSYPTATLAKSSKLIPTMLMGLIVERKSYERSEWTGAVLITLGITIFNFSRMSSSSSDSSAPSSEGDSPYGIGLLIFSLVMDGFLGSFQSMLKRPHKSSAHRPPKAIELMLFMNFYALLFVFPLSTVLTNQFANGMRLVQSSAHAIKLILLLNVASACGQIFIFFTIHIFSPLMCTTITTTRKFMTICLSVLKFGHVLSFTEWSCVGMVFSGMYMEIVSKSVVSGTKQKKE